MARKSVQSFHKRLELELAGFISVGDAQCWATGPDHKGFYKEWRDSALGAGYGRSEDPSMPSLEDPALEEDVVPDTRSIARDSRRTCRRRRGKTSPLFYLSRLAHPEGCYAARRSPLRGKAGEPVWASTGRIGRSSSHYGGQTFGGRKSSWTGQLGPRHLANSHEES